MLTKSLRHYQEDAVCSIFQYFQDHRDPNENPIVALPTGTGKSLVIAEFLYRALRLYVRTRVLIITHVKELIEQNHGELLELWPTAPCGVYSAGLRRKDIDQPITFCGVASVAKRVEDFGYIDLVLIDECHLVSDKVDTQYAKVIGLLRLVNPGVRVVGFTATPYRLGTGLLTEGRVFTDICCDWTTLERFNQLVDEGFICPLIPRRTQTELSVEGVGLTNGEFNIDELQAAVDQDHKTRAALNEAVRLAKGRWSWLVFCAGTKHADHARDILRELGIPALSVHTALGPEDGTRDANIAKFKRMEIAALCNVGVLTTGFNHQPIDCIVVLRPTMSASLWVQFLGRGTRPYDYRTTRDPYLARVCQMIKKDCLVLDFAANTRRLGPINDPVIPRKKGKKGSGGAPYKLCPVCDAYNHTRARFCIGCQHEFPSLVAIGTNAASDELIRKKKEPKAVEPVVVPLLEVFKVDRVEYMKHFSRDPNKPPSLLVSYHCGLRIFNEWLCLEHPQGYARHKARDAWRIMSPEQDILNDVPPPETIDDALSCVDRLRPPSAVRVLLKQKWPEVVGYDFNEHVPINGVEAAIASGDIPF